MALGTFAVIGTAVAFYQAAESNKETQGLAYIGDVCKDAVRNMGIGAAAAAVAYFAIENAPTLFAALPSIGELVAMLPAGEAIAAFAASAWTAISGFAIEAGAFVATYAAEAAAIVMGLTLTQALIIGAVAAVAIAIIGTSIFLYQNWDQVKAYFARPEAEIQVVDDLADDVVDPLLPVSSNGSHLESTIVSPSKGADNTTSASNSPKGKTPKNPTKSTTATPKKENDPTVGTQPVQPNGPKKEKGSLSSSSESSTI